MTCIYCGGETNTGGACVAQCYWSQNKRLESSKSTRWNTSPIEDELRAEIARLQEKLHDEMSQLEIATDLGNKRWVALNDIYENGEKHNANWCKRKAQEGLGIK